MCVQDLRQLPVQVHIQDLLFQSLLVIATP